MVSVVIPTYNRAAYVSEALQSVLAQTYADYEVIVVDDGSTDQTRGIVEAFVARDPKRVRYVYQANGGLSAARNTGCRLAQGRYVGLLDSDDLWKPQKLAIQLPHLERDPQVGLVSARAEAVDAANSRVLHLKPQQPAGTTLREMIAQGTQPPSSFLVRREAGESIGWFDPAIRRGIEDVDFCFRLARTWRFVCLEEPLIRYRLHTTNLSSEPIGTYEGYVQTYEKLLTTPDPRVPRGVAKHYLAKYLYLLGTAQRRIGSPAARRHIWRALQLNPWVGWSLDSWQSWPHRLGNVFKAQTMAVRVCTAARPKPPAVESA